jgi:glutathione S-transferase
MTLFLYYHPFSSFCQKVLIALYEKELEFEPYLIDLGDERSRAELTAIWPFAKFPVLHHLEAGVTLPESSLIVEYVDTLSQAGPNLLPADPVRARNARLLDRTLDNYLHVPMQKIVADRLRPEGRRDPHGVEEARATIATAYRQLERGLGATGWLNGSDFSLADCAAAPPLFYLTRVAPFDAYPKLQAYFGRLMERPSFRRCVEEARQYRPFFPAADSDAGWPDEELRVAF